MAIQFNTDERIQYDGKTATVSSESAAYITVVTEDGERVSVPKNSALLSFANNDDELKKFLEENKQEIKGYKQAWTQARDEKRGFLHQLGSFWRDLGLASGSVDKLNSEQAAQYASLQDGKFDAITAMHRASNGVHRTVHESLSAITSFRAMT
ncbi:MAG: hypothetical protein NC408_04890 [Candidatus Gastranaerophilales bacterium]|nr:hypothetical protein [Candidatus Gastranaerophilales bacterium]MCM1072814.1 hypothetical protein [Bacteroides sp.]